jgi:hypothetical protein
LAWPDLNFERVEDCRAQLPSARPYRRNAPATFLFVLMFGFK